MASGGSFEWKRKLRIKQIKLLFIAHCCPFTFNIHSLWQWRRKNIYRMFGKKVYTMPLPYSESEKKAQRSLWCVNILFSSHSGDVFFPLCRSVFYFHPSEDFISSFLLILLQRYQFEERATCENVFYLFFVNFLYFSLKCKITVFFSLRKKADADVAAKLLLKVNICFKEHPLERWIRDRK